MNSRSNSMRCTDCGQDNPEEARFCFACGKPIAPGLEAAVAPAALAAAARASLTTRRPVDVPGPRLCPACRLLVGGTTTRCECGYDFHVGASVIGDVANTVQGGAYYPCTIVKLVV